MTNRGDPRFSLAIFLLVGSWTTFTSGQDQPADVTEQVDLKAVWNKVLEVNQVWLDPRPKSLSYKITSGSPPPAEPETTQFVWISDNKARWEMDSTIEPNQLKYTLIMTPEGRNQRGQDSLIFKPGMLHSYDATSPPSR